MTERHITSREQWLRAAILATQGFIVADEAENAYDLRSAAPGSRDYDTAVDSQACLELARTTLAALEAEITEIRRRSELRTRT